MNSKPKTSFCFIFLSFCESLQLAVLINPGGVSSKQKVSLYAVAGDLASGFTTQFSVLEENTGPHNCSFMNIFFGSLR